MKCKTFCRRVVTISPGLIETVLFEKDEDLNLKLTLGKCTIHGTCFLSGILPSAVSWRSCGSLVWSPQWPPIIHKPIVTISFLTVVIQWQAVLKGGRVNCDLKGHGVQPIVIGRQRQDGRNVSPLITLPLQLGSKQDTQSGIGSKKPQRPPSGLFTPASLNLRLALSQVLRIWGGFEGNTFKL